jgi:hypothetical protein
LQEFEAKRASIVGKVVVAPTLEHDDYRKQLAALLRREVTNRGELASSPNCWIGPLQDFRHVNPAQQKPTPAEADAGAGDATTISVRLCGFSIRPMSSSSRALVGRRRAASMTAKHEGR